MYLSSRNAQIILIVIFTLFYNIGFLNALDIVKDGKAVSIIIISPDAPTHVLFAAQELKDYIKKTSGAEIPIQNSLQSDDKNKTIIYLGKTILNREKLSPDGFRIFAKGNSLFISGRDYTGIPEFGAPHPMRKTESYSDELKISRFGETGTLFGVYHFLEEYCGIRWYMPGELGEVVPSNSSITVPDNLNITVNPDFEYRVLYNCDFPKDKDGTLWYRRAGYGALFPVQINHSFHYLNRYAKEHPEYFAIIDGDKRDINISNPLGNLCLSNPEVADRFVELIDEYFKKNPEKHIFAVMPNDVIRVCECPVCQAQINSKAEIGGKHSDYVWNFVNKVAERIYKLHPDKFIGCACYAEYLFPPSRKLSPNILIQFCVASRTFCDPVIKKHYTDLINEWTTKLSKGNIYYWDYYNWLYGGGSLFKNIPVAFPHIISDNLKFLKGKIRGEFIEAENWDSDNKEKKIYYPALTHLNWYITGKLLWNADADVDKLLEDYYTNFYGPAKDEMKKFWMLAETLWMKNTSETQNDLYNTVYTENNVNKLLNILEQAKEKTLTSSLERKRIELIIFEMTPLKTRVTNLRIINKPSYVCKHTTIAPAFNSEANEQCWSNSTLVDFVATNGESARYKTQMSISYDDDNLYLLFLNYGDTSHLKAYSKERDSMSKPYIWEDDSIEIFINPNPQYEKDYFQFIINASGTIFDGHIGDDNFKNNPQRWNSRIQSRITLTPSLWILKIEIPFKDLNLSGSLPPFISANFFRNTPTDDGVQASCWSPTLTGNNHTLSRFGKIVFESNHAQAKSEFSEAYEYFSGAKAGDNHEWGKSYKDASAHFETLAFKTQSPKEKLISVLLSALCLYLDSNFEKANKTAAAALLLAQKLYPDDPSINSLEILQNDKDFNFSKNLYDKLISIPRIEEANAELYKQLKRFKPAISFSPGSSSPQNASTPLILSVLLTKFAPSGNEITEKMDQSLCVSRLRQIGILLFLYAEDNDSRLPCSYEKGKGTWMNILSRYEKNLIKGNSVWEKNESSCKYGMNAYMTYALKGDISRINDSAKMILVADSVHFIKEGDYPSTPNYAGASYMLSPRFEHPGLGTTDRTRHQGGCNILFADGHVEWLPAEKISIDSKNPLWQ